MDFHPDAWELAEAFAGPAPVYCMQLNMRTRTYLRLKAITRKCNAKKGSPLSEELGLTVWAPLAEEDGYCSRKPTEQDEVWLRHELETNYLKGMKVVAIEFASTEKYSYGVGLEVYQTWNVRVVVESCST